ncbi:MAG: TlpA disulfide reductase family protein [Bacteroidota bacterium]
MKTARQIFFAFYGLLLSSSLFLSCDQIGGSGGAISSNLTIEGDFNRCAIDSIRLYRLTGLTTDVLGSAAIVNSGERSTFSLETEPLVEGLYLLGQAPNNLMPILLGRESKVSVSGNCNNLRQFGKVEGSAFNDQYAQLNQLFGNFNGRRNQLVQQLNGALAAGSADQQSAIGQQLSNLYNQQKATIDSLKGADAFFAAAFAPNVVEAFNPLNNPEGYPNSAVHFAEKFLQGLDFTDKVYESFPIIPDNLRVYTQTLFQNLEMDAAKPYIDAKLAAMPQGSRLHQNALAAVVQTLDRLENEAFLTYADRYMSTYVLQASEQSYLDGRRPAIERKAQLAKKLAVGAVPPEIELPNPDGKVIRLSDLKGKYVLLDFWASWCRPCRAENPNVVRVYDEYKNKGFEILGISLDRTRDAWIKAIADDGLNWKHVSDLQFWNSVAAKDYSVGSIPATFLLDKEGKIIAKNLRGPSLEAKLAEVLGS